MPVCNLPTVGCALLARVLVAVEPSREFGQLIHGGDANRLRGGCCFFLGVRGCLRNLFKFTLWAKSNKTSGSCCRSQLVKALSSLKQQTARNVRGIGLGSFWRCLLQTSVVILSQQKSVS